MPRKKLIYTVLLVLCILITGISYHLTKKTNENNLADLPTYLPQDNLQESTESTESSTMESSNKTTIFIHICGEVVNPGVYEVNEGVRGYEVIDLAGGFTEFAAKDYLNLAQLVKDGDKLTIPNLNNLEQPFGEDTGADTSQSTLVNINQASITELMTLPGIGESKANAIIKYREKVGGFTSIEEIMNISGIKNAAFEKIEEFITVK